MAKGSTAQNRYGINTSSASTRVRGNNAEGRRAFPLLLSSTIHPNWLSYRAKGQRAARGRDLITRPQLEARGCPDALGRRNSRKRMERALVALRELLRKTNQKLAKFASLEFVKCFHEPHGAGGLQQIEHTCVLASCAFRISDCSEEERDRHLERFGDLLKSASADSIHAFLVFLNLLEGDSNSVRQLSLRKTIF